MPYEIKKVGGGYKVVSKDTGKEHSSRPMSHEKAYAQMRILYASMGPESRRKK